MKKVQILDFYLNRKEKILTEYHDLRESWYIAHDNNFQCATKMQYATQIELREGKDLFLNTDATSQNSIVVGGVRTPP